MAHSGAPALLLTGDGAFGCHRRGARLTGGGADALFPLLPGQVAVRVSGDGGGTSGSAVLVGVSGQAAALAAAGVLTASMVGRGPDTAAATIGRSVEAAATTLSRGTESAATTLSRSVEAAATTLSRGTEAAATTLSRGAEAAATTLSRGTEAAATTLGASVNSLGQSIQSAATTLGGLLCVGMVLAAFLMRTR